MSKFNNIFNKKNVEYSLEEKSNKLPYSTQKEVELAVDQILFNPVNDSFQKLLDNDLYNEALLKQYIEEGREGVGPSLASSLEEVLNSAGEGRKFVVSGENGISVVHKVTMPVADTVSNRFLNGVKVNKTTFIDNAYFAAAYGGLYSSADKKIWNKALDYPNVDFVDVCYNYNYLLDSKSLLSGFDWLVLANDSNGLKFFGRNGIDLNWVDFSTEETLSSFKLDRAAGTHLYSFEGDHKLYVGTNGSGLMSFEGYVGDSLKKEPGTSNWKTNDLVKIKREDPSEVFLAATDYGIKQSGSKEGFKNLGTVAEISSDMLLNDVLKHDGDIYLGTTNGLYKISEDGTHSLVEGSKDKNITSLESNRGKIYAAAITALYEVNEDGLSRISSIKAKLLKSLDGTLFVSKNTANRTISYQDEFNPSNFINALELDPGIEVNQLVAYNKRLYVATSDGIVEISSKEAEQKFLPSENLIEDSNQLRFKFSKNISKSEVVLQDSSNVVYRIASNSPFVSRSFDKELLDVARAGNEGGEDIYYFVVKEEIGSSIVYGSFNSNLSQVPGADNVSKIVWTNGFLAFLQNGEVFAYQNSETVKISKDSALFSSIANVDGSLYGLSGNSIVQFKEKTLYDVSSIGSTEWNVVETQFYAEDTVLELSVSDTSLLAETDTNMFRNEDVAEPVDLSFSLNGAGFNSASFVGYAGDKANRLPVLLISDSERVSAYALSTEVVKDEEDDSVSILTSVNFIASIPAAGKTKFADVYGYDGAVLTSGTNLITEGRYVKALAATNSFYSLSTIAGNELPKISDAFVGTIDGEDIVLLATENGIYSFDKDATFDFLDLVSLEGRNILKIYKKEDGNFYVCEKENGVLCGTYEDIASDQELKEVLSEEALEELNTVDLFEEANYRRISFEAVSAEADVLSGLSQISVDGFDSRMISSIYSDDGRLLVGSKDGTVYKLKENQGQYSLEQVQDEAVPLSTILEDEQANFFSINGTLSVVASNGIDGTDYAVNSFYSTDIVSENRTAVLNETDSSASICDISKTPAPFYGNYSQSFYLSAFELSIGFSFPQSYSFDLVLSTYLSCYHTDTVSSLVTVEISNTVELSDGTLTTYTYLTTEVSTEISDVVSERISSFVKHIDWTDPTFYLSADVLDSCYQLIDSYPARFAAGYQISNSSSQSFEVTANCFLSSEATIETDDRTEVPVLLQSNDGLYKDGIYLSSLETISTEYTIEPEEEGGEVQTSVVVEEVVDYENIEGFIARFEDKYVFFDGSSLSAFDGFVPVSKDTKYQFLHTPYNGCFYSAKDFSENYVRNLKIADTCLDPIEDALTSDGGILCINAFDGKLYVAKNDGLYEADDFPYFSKILGLPFSSLYSDSNGFYGLHSNALYKIDVVSHTAELKLQNVKAAFEREGEVIAQTTDGRIKKIDGTTIDSLVPDMDLLGYIGEVESLESPAYVAEDGIYFRNLTYDFRSSYSNVLNLNGNIVDLKKQDLAGHSYLFVADSSSIQYLQCDDASDVAQSNLKTLLDDSSIRSIEAIAFGEDSQLIVADGSNIIVFEDLLSGEDASAGINGAIDVSEACIISGAIQNGSSIAMVDYEREEESIVPLIFVRRQGETDADLSSIFQYTAIRQSKDGLDVATDGNQHSFDFNVDYSNGRPCIVDASNPSEIYFLEYQGGDLTCEKTDLLTTIDPSAAYIETGSSIWTISNQAPLYISGNAAIGYESYEEVDRLFALNSEPYYYSTSGSGILKKTEVHGYLTSSNVLDSADKDVHTLLFFGLSSYIYNYTVSSIVSGYSGDISDEPLDSDGVSSVVRVSAFDTSEDASDLSSAVNKEYQTSDGMVASLKIGNYVFLASRVDGYAYDLVRKTGNKISFEQLNSLGLQYPILTLAENEDGKIYLGYSGSLLSANSFGKFMCFGNPAKDLKVLTNNFRSGTNVIVPTKGDSDFLVGSSFGLKYIYDKIMARSFIDRNDKSNSINGNVLAIEKAMASENDYCYIVAQGNSLYEVTGLKPPEFSKVLVLAEDETVLDVFVLQKNEYLIATTKGLYTTENRGMIVNDLTRFTVNNVYAMINEELAKVIAKHLEDYHYKGSLIDKINKKADTELSFISTEDRHVDRYDYSIANGIRVVENDIIDTIELGGRSSDADSFVKAAVKNWATDTIETESFYSDDGFVSKFIDPTSNKTFDISTVPYIIKNWKSGLKEIYVYVPTTATYYINNPVGMSNSIYTYNAIARENVPGASNINSLPDCCTTLRIYLYNSHFGIKTILAAQCVGNSLPLKIYKDNVNEDDSWKGFFDTVVQPSALRTLPKTSDASVNNVRICTDDLDRIYLDFSIYGTDAQAIRIIAES